MAQELAVVSTFAITRFNSHGNGQNVAMLFLTLRDWE